MASKGITGEVQYIELQQPAMNQIGEEVLDPNIHDDHGDPHKAAFEPTDASGRVSIMTWAAVFFLGLTLVSALNFTLNSFVAVAPTVALHIQGSLDNLNWITGGFSLAGSVSFAIAGQLSDYFGRKDIVLAGQACLLIGHLLGATAQSFSQLVAAMVILGFGTGISFVVFVSISEILPNRRRSLGIALTEVNIAVVGMFGPIIARALTRNITWRWLFILGDITAVIALAGTLLFYHPPNSIFRDRSKRQIFSELDYLGICLYSAGTTSLLLGLGWAGSQYAWQSAADISTIVIGATLLILTFTWGFTGLAKRPLLPYRLFRQFKAFSSIVIIAFASGLAHVVLASFVPQQISYVFTSNQITAGWYQLPTGCGGLVGSFVLGSLVPRLKHIPLQFLVANVVQAIGCGFLAIATPDRIAVGLVFQGIASIPFVWTVVLSYTTIGLHVPQRDIGLAYGLVGASRYLGGAIGSTIFNTILQNEAKKTLPRRVAAAVIPLGYPESDIGKLLSALRSGQTSGLAKIPLKIVLAAKDALRWGYSDAFAYVWYASLPFFVIACFFSIFVLDPTPYFTNHTAVIATKKSQNEARISQNRGVETATETGV